MSRQSSAIWRTAASKRSALDASAAPLSAPAEVPQMMRKGLLRSGSPLSRRISMRAWSTPTW